MSEMRIAAQYQELFSRWLRRSSSSSLSGRCCSRLCSLPFGSLLSRLLLSRLSSLDAHGSLARPGLRECCCRRIARKAGNLPAASCRGLTWLAAVGSHAACGWELEVSEVKSWRCSARAAVMLVRGLRCQRSAHARHHPRCCPSSLCCRAWPTTSSRCCPASTTGHLAHRAGLREPASSRRPLCLRPRAAGSSHDAPAPVAALRCRQHLPSYHLPPPRRRAVRSSTPTRQPMLLGGRRRGPRLCRLAAGPAQPSSLPSRQPVRTTVQPPCRPRDAPNHQQAQQSRRAGRVATAPAFSPTPTRLGYAVASASSRSQRCIGEPAARRVSTSAAAVTGGPTSAGRANHALQTAPSCVCPSATPALVGLRPAGAHQRGCAVVPLAHAPRWQLEAAAAAPECQPITLLQPSESTSLLLPRHLPLAFDQQPTNVCAVPSCRPRHHIVEAAVP